jgi:hypothetical protein
MDSMRSVDLGTASIGDNLGGTGDGLHGPSSLIGDANAKLRGFSDAP